MGAVLAGTVDWVGLARFQGRGRWRSWPIVRDLIWAQTNVVIPQLLLRASQALPCALDRRLPCPCFR